MSITKNDYLYGKLSSSYVSSGIPGNYYYEDQGLRKNLMVLSQAIIRRDEKLIAELLCGYCITKKYIHIYLYKLIADLERENSPQSNRILELLSRFRDCDNNIQSRL